MQIYIFYLTHGGSLWEFCLDIYSHRYIYIYKHDLVCWSYYSVMGTKKGIILALESFDNYELYTVGRNKEEEIKQKQDASIFYKFFNAVHTPIIYVVHVGTKSMILYKKN